MGELGNFFGGLKGKSKTDFENGNARYISYVNIANNISIQLSRNDFVKVAANENQTAIRFGDILFTGSSETPNEVGLTSGVEMEPEEPIYLNSFCFGFRTNEDEKLNVKFSKHLFRAEVMRSQIIRCANGVTRFNLSKALLARVLVPIPDEATQLRIAETLDRFEALVNDISIGLPAELNARRQQYEYYRDKLLNFKEIESA